LTYPNIVESEKPTSKGSNRFPMTGTIDEIGSDIRKIKDMGVLHIVLGFFFSPIYGDIDKTIEVSKQLSKFTK
jgi:hypothetical protein